MWSLLTKRCFLRDYGEEDREAFVALNTDPVARRHMNGPLDNSEANSLFNRVLRDTDPRHGIRWAVFDRKSNEYLGHVFLIPWDTKFQMEWGLILKPEHWGRGLGEEVGEVTLEHIFTEKPIKKVVATVDTEHLSSIKLLRKLGMECAERCQDDSGYYYVFELPKARFVEHSALEAAPVASR